MITRPARAPHRGASSTGHSWTWRLALALALIISTHVAVGGVPTPSPSHSPSIIATKDPTLGDPTPPPTVSPKPTSVPTLHPTRLPTAQPTHSPSGLPTTNPQPTPEPTRWPTTGPTEPTSVPTLAPTDTPAPTPKPTKPPTLAPSLATSEYPTLMPVQPTSYPSGSPTYPPSPSPTIFEIDNHVALAALYRDTEGPKWTKKANWMVGLPCEEAWEGVECESPDSQLPGCIIKLKLGRVGLHGSLPTELGLLTSLNALWLAQNTLTGSIPSELGLLARADTFYLSKNSLSGSLPSELGGLQAAKVILLYENLLTGSLPTELATIKDLQRLRVHDNEGLCGVLPPFGIQLQTLTYEQTLLGAPCETPAPTPVPTPVPTAAISGFDVTLTFKIEAFNEFGGYDSLAVRDIWTKYVGKHPTAGDYDSEAFPWSTLKDSRIDFNLTMGEKHADNIPRVITRVTGSECGGHLQVAVYLDLLKYD